MPGPGDLFAEEGLALIRGRCALVPDVAVVLGSGLGDAVSGEIRPEAEFAFESFLHNFHVQKTKKAAAETEAERDGIFRLVSERSVVQF